MSTTDNPSSAIERHPWLAWCTPDQRIHALHGCQSAWSEVYRDAFGWIGVTEMMAAMQDPELPGLYVPPPLDAEAFVKDMRRTYMRPFAVPEGMSIEQFARLLQLRSHLSTTVTEEYLQAMSHRFTVEDTFNELNHRYHFVQNVGGKVRIVWWEKVHGQIVLQMQSVDEFRKAHMNLRVVEQNFHPQSGKWTYCAMPAVDLWLKAENRPSKARLVFRPGQEVEPEELNLWHGFAVRPAAEIGTDKIDRFLTFLHDVICAGDAALADYVWHWMANAVQNPHKPGETALVLQSGQGTGKGVFARTFGKLFGRHFLQSANAKHILGDFNAHLRYCVLLYADEAFFAGDRRQANSLKALITEPTLMIEGKGIDSEPSANCIHLIVSSNEQHVVRVEDDDRRLCVLRVSEGWKNDREKFAAMLDDMEDGGYEQLLAALLDASLNGWAPQPVPDTAAKAEQKLLTSEDTWDEALTAAIDRALMGHLRRESHPLIDIVPATHEQAAHEAAVDALLAAQGVRAHTGTLLELLGIEPRFQDRKAQERVAAVMRRLGWKHGPIRVMGVPGKGYTREGDGRRGEIHLKVANDVTVTERYARSGTAKDQ